MIARWPNGLPQDIENDDQIVFTDWLPTLTSLAKIKHVGNKPLDGIDMSASLMGEPQHSAPRRFWQFNGYSPIGATNAAVREGPWKLVRPALDISYATDADQTLADRYTEKDIEYKYHPENFSHVFEWPEPERIVPKPPNPELYDIGNDPLEQHDVAAQNPDIALKLLRNLETWFEEVESERQSLVK
jgi:arylsulfatase A-like enzyme